MFLSYRSRRLPPPFFICEARSLPDPAPAGEQSGAHMTSLGNCVGTREETGAPRCQPLQTSFSLRPHRPGGKTETNSSVVAHQPRSTTLATTGSRVVEHSRPPLVAALTSACNSATTLLRVPTCSASDAASPGAPDLRATESCRCGMSGGRLGREARRARRPP